MINTKPITITITPAEAFSLTSAIRVLGEVFEKMEIEAPVEFKEHLASVLEKMAYELMNQVKSDGEKVMKEALSHDE